MRSLVVKHFENGDSYAVIAKKTLLPRSTVQYIIKRYKNTKCIVNMRGRGRRRKTTAAVDRIIQRKIKADWRKSASSVKVELEKEYGVIIHANTVRNRIHEIGLYGRVARKKPLLNKDNRTKRIRYAKTMLEKSFSYWKDVLWSDESKFNLFGSDGKIMVWRSTNEEFDPRCTAPTVKYQAGSVMVWGCFSRVGVGNLHFIDGIMDRFMYREILEKNLTESARKLGLGPNFVFQHDNDPTLVEILLSSVRDPPRNCSGTRQDSPDYPEETPKSLVKSEAMLNAGSWQDSQTFFSKRELRILRQILVDFERLARRYSSKETYQDLIRILSTNLFLDGWTWDRSRDLPIVNRLARTYELYLLEETRFNLDCLW